MDSSSGWAWTSKRRRSDTPNSVVRHDRAVTDPQDSYPRQRARTRGFRLGAPRSLTPSRDGERVAFLRSRGGTDPLTCLWVLDVASGTERCVVDPRELLDDEESLPPQERARRERMREVAGGVTDFAVDREARVAVFALSGVPYAVRLDDPAARAVALDAPGPAIDPRPDPTGTKAAFVSDRSLYVVPLAGGRAAVLCRPDADDVTWGLADFIAAEELDRVRGYWWLVDGAGLLVERVDDSPVATWWIADPAHPDQPAISHRYPAAGTNNAAVSLWLVRIDDEGDVVRTEVEWDHAALPYLATVSCPSGGDPLISLLSRDQRRQVVLSIDPETAKTVVVRERTDPEWIDVMPGVPTRTPSGAAVEIVADRECDTNRLVVDGTAITSPALQVEAVLDAGDDDVLIVAGRDPVRSAVCRVAPDGAVTEVLTGGTVGARRAGPLLCAATTSLGSTATDTAVWRGGERIATVRSYAEVPIISPSVTMLRVGELDLRTAVLFPGDHVPGARRLPVIMSPYGGPHARMAIESGLMFGTAQWLADQGYCVIVADGRGTPGRGPAWDRSVRGDLATPALDDQVAALEGVAAVYPDDLDTSRVGIRGWSFGGYLAALAVLRRPDVFHAGVAGAPVTEWRLYDTGYTERYLGLPQEDPAAFDRSSLLPLAAQLTRPLLIIHGLADDNVVVAHTLQLSSALLAAGRPHGVLPLSSVTHMTPQEVVAENLLRAEVDFFAEALARG
ncbi:MAG: S9 family peptidase [Actinobacteria bacterium]|nr:S9 family peptidase [Actinomycetota bacterium]